MMMMMLLMMMMMPHMMPGTMSGMMPGMMGGMMMPQTMSQHAGESDEDQVVAAAIVFPKPCFFLMEPLTTCFFLGPLAQLCLIPSQGCQLLKHLSDHLQAWHQINLCT